MLARAIVFANHIKLRSAGLPASAPGRNSAACAAKRIRRPSRLSICLSGSVVARGCELNIAEGQLVVSCGTTHAGSVGLVVGLVAIGRLAARFHCASGAQVVGAIYLKTEFVWPTQLESKSLCPAEA
jgi:hypothetical protein